MRFLGYDEKLVRLLESLYEGRMSAVRVDGGLTEWFVTVIKLESCRVAYSLHYCSTYSWK